eukprot:2480577-Pleurochrysis_carterae.AAC.3
MAKAMQAPAKLKLAAALPLACAPRSTLRAPCQHQQRNHPLPTQSARPSAAAAGAAELDCAASPAGVDSGPACSLAEGAGDGSEPAGSDAGGDGEDEGRAG